MIVAYFFGLPYIQGGPKK